MAFEATNENKSGHKIIRRKNSSPVVESKPVIEDTQENEILLEKPEKDVSFLLQDSKALEDATEKAPRNIPLWENEAKIKTLQTMNAIRMLSPAIGIAIKEASEDQQQAEIFTEIMSRVNKLAVITGTIIGADDNNKYDKWIFNTLERVYSESMTTSDILFSDSAEKLAHAVVKAGEDRVSDKEDFVQLPANMHMKIAIIKAMSPVMIEYNKFDFFRNEEEDMEILSDLIFEKTSNAILELVDPFTKEQERVILFQILSELAGKFLSESWSLAAKILQEDLSNKTDREMDILKSANPKGFSIASVIEDFEENFRKLVDISKNIKLPAKKRY